LESEWVVVVVFTVTVTATGAAETRSKEVARVERMALNSIVLESKWERMVVSRVDERERESLGGVGFWVQNRLRILRVSR
jgi:hypothetical protein